MDVSCSETLWPPVFALATEDQRTENVMYLSFEFGKARVLIRRFVRVGGDTGVCWRWRWCWGAVRV
eukprot:577543-Rhodomonas_salina.1